MRRDQLEHAIRAACQIIGADEVIIIGSQAILGSLREDRLPDAATRSREVDILPIADTDAETERLADLIEGAAGEMSPFEDLHGFSLDGVDLHTAMLPAGWRKRLVKVQNANTAAPSGRPRYIGWCVERHDLCVEKLYALREKDLRFVAALLDAGIVRRDLILERLGTLPIEADPERASAAMRWLRGRPDDTPAADDPVRP